MSLTVKAIALNKEWEHTFDGVARTAHIGAIKHLIEASVKAAAIDRFSHSTRFSISLLINGTVIPYDDVPLQNIVASTSSYVNLHVLILDDNAPLSTPSMQAPITHMMDPISFAAAQAWIERTGTAIAEHESVASPSSSPAVQKVKALKRVMSAFEHQQLSSSTRGAAVPPDQAAGVVDAQPADAAGIDQNINQPRIELFRNLPQVQWLQWGLIAKLIVTSILFSYNRHMSIDRMLGVAGVALLTYFVQIGAFNYWFRVICIYVGADRNIANENANRGIPAVQPNGEQQRNGVGNAAVAAGNDIADVAPPAAAAPADAAAAGRAEVSWAQMFTHLTENGVGIPTSPGITMDIAAFLIGFFCSLLPNWNPVRRPHLQ